MIMATMDTPGVGMTVSMGVRFHASQVCVCVCVCVIHSHENIGLYMGIHSPMYIVIYSTHTYAQVRC